MRSKYWAMQLPVIGLAWLFAASPADAGDEGFVTVSGPGFQVDGEPFRFVGANFWQGMNLGADLETGDRERLRRELDRLQAMGVTNLRVMASSEGPDGAPYRMTPTLMTSPGRYNDALFQGLDRLLAEMAGRGMRAVMVLNNFWSWSGGMAQYVSWVDGGSRIPTPNDGSDSWDEYIDYSARFYADPAIRDQCQRWYLDHVETVLDRVNTVNNRAYRDDPTIFAWELANEPRGYPQSWINDTAAFIKARDSNHLVTAGSEGSMGGDFLETHRSPFIDYTTAHIWVENWGIYNPGDSSESNIANAETYALEYLRTHERWSRDLSKPFVLEEFGLARDGWTSRDRHDPEAPATNRLRYYRTLYGEVMSLVRDPRSAMAGDNFWAWAGEARPSDPFPQWLGDPPHEPAGWYSIYDIDGGMISLITSHAAEMSDPSAGASCTDIPPDSRYTCAEQAGWGKCGEPWMQGRCDESCGRCPSASPRP